MDFGHVHRQGPRMISEARNVCFGITGARNRPSPALLPYKTCAQTPLGRPKMLLRRDPNLADAPETAQNGGFRHRFATECIFADLSLPIRRSRPKSSFAREHWLRNVAGAKYSISPHGHFFGLETGTYWHHSIRAGALDAQAGAQNPQRVGSQAPRPL